MPSKSLQLTKMFGGVWKYDGWTRWECADGRYVARHSDGIDECGDPVGIKYVMYDEAGNARRIHFGPNAAIVNAMYK